MSINIKTTLFHADWCGHCVSFKPEWKKYVEKIKKINGVETIDFKDTQLNESNSLINGKKIQGFPTIKIEIIKNGKKDEYEYNGKRNADELYTHILKQTGKY